MWHCGAPGLRMGTAAGAGRIDVADDTGPGRAAAAGTRKGDARRLPRPGRDERAAEPGPAPPAARPGPADPAPVLHVDRPAAGPGGPAGGHDPADLLGR